MIILKKIFIWIPVIIMAGIIFDFSSQDGNVSQGLSDKVAEVTVTTAEKVKLIKKEPTKHKKYVEQLQFPIRKGAHMTEYAILTILVVIALWVDGLRIRFRYVVAWFICTVFAMTDEFHQLFVAGRSGQLVDVFIDSAGCLIGLFLYFTIDTLRKKKRSR